MRSRSRSSSSSRHTAVMQQCICTIFAGRCCMARLDLLDRRKPWRPRWRFATHHSSASIQLCSVLPLPSSSSSTCILLSMAQFRSRFTWCSLSDLRGAQSQQLPRNALHDDEVFFGRPLPLHGASAETNTRPPPQFGCRIRQIMIMVSGRRHTLPVFQRTAHLHYSSGYVGQS